MSQSVENPVTATDPERTALVIAHEPDGAAGQVAVRLGQRGFSVHTHLVTADYEKPNVAAPFPEWSDYDLVAIMGSVRSVTNKDEISTWVHDELDLIRKARAANQPLLGVCFGGQLIADALGGTVELAPVTELGWHEITAEPGQTNPVGPGPWMEWHHDRFTAPPEATVLASTEDAVQLFSVGRIVATQFHPEVDVTHITNWLEQAPDDYLASHGRDRTSILEEMQAHEDRNNDQCHALVDWFIDSVAFPATTNVSSQAVPQEINQ